MKADAHAWWCYASVRAALPDDETVWTVVDVGYLEKRGGISDGIVTVRCTMKMSMRYPIWGVRGPDEDDEGTRVWSLSELGQVITELRARHRQEVA